MIRDMHADGAWGKERGIVFILSFFDKHIFIDGASEPTICPI